MTKDDILKNLNDQLTSDTVHKNIAEVKNLITNTVTNFKESSKTYQKTEIPISMFDKNISTHTIIYKTILNEFIKQYPEINIIVYNFPKSLYLILRKPKSSNNSVEPSINSNQIKIFMDSVDHVKDLEKRVNNFLKSHSYVDLKITHVKRTIIMTVVYN